MGDVGGDQLRGRKPHRGLAGAPRAETAGRARASDHAERPILLDYFTTGKRSFVAATTYGVIISHERAAGRVPDKSRPRLAPHGV